MKTLVHVIGSAVQYEYEPEAGKVLARTWRLPDGGTLEVCFHCDRTRRVAGELESEIPHDADECDVCGTTTTPKIFDPAKAVKLDLTDAEWESFDRAIRDGRGRRES